MAIMGRRKKGVAQGWNATNKERDEETKKNADEFEEKHKKEVSEEEHKERIEMLKKIGILKE